MNDIFEEIREENALLDEMEAKIRRHKIRFIRRVAIAITAVVLIIVGSYMIISHQTYNSVRILEAFSGEMDSGERYVEFADGILKYSRDGVSFINRKGKEQWNASYQIKNPIISINGESAAIADKSGNDMVVFEKKKGLKGEIHTNLPIEKIAVSGQGIVSAILKDDRAALIACYDAAGNILVEHKTSAVNTGYPVALDISDNGCMLLVSYLMIEDGVITSKIAYYNFGNEGQKKDNYLVTEDTYKGVVVPSVFFMDNEVSAVVADDAVMIYKGKKTPEKTATLEMENGIKSVFHDRKHIGVVLKSENKEKNTVKLYNRNGAELLSEPFEGEYNNIKISKGQIFMHEGKKCTVIAKTGIHKFEGEFETDIVDIFPISGINKYLVINANGLEEIRFAK